jgi:hypothetical protein
VTIKYYNYAKNKEMSIDNVQAFESYNASEHIIKVTYLKYNYLINSFISTKAITEIIF